MWHTARTIASGWNPVFASRRIRAKQRQLPWSSRPETRRWAVSQDHWQFPAPLERENIAVARNSLLSHIARMNCTVCGAREAARIKLSMIHFFLAVPLYVRLRVGFRGARTFPIGERTHGDTYRPHTSRSGV
jgi:hypothetical protein